MKRTLFISFGALALLSHPAFAQENSASEQKNLTIMGLSLDMSPSRAQQYIRQYHGDWREADSQLSRASEASIYTLPEGETVRIDITGPVQDREISSLRYEFKDIPGRDEQLSTQMRARFGRPLQVYALPENKELQIWQTEPQNTGQDIGTYHMIALQTGDDGYLSLSRVEGSFTEISANRETALQNTPITPVRNPFETTDPRNSY